MIELTLIEKLIKSTVNRRKLSWNNVAINCNIARSTLCNTFTRKDKHLRQENIDKILLFLGITNLKNAKPEKQKQYMKIKGNYHRIFSDFVAINETELEREQYTDELREYCQEHGNYPYENTAYINSVKSAFYCYLHELTLTFPNATIKDISKPFDFPEFSFAMYIPDDIEPDYDADIDGTVLIDNELKENMYLEILEKYSFILSTALKKQFNKELNQINKVPF